MFVVKLPLAMLVAVIFLRFCSHLSNLDINSNLPFASNSYYAKTDVSNFYCEN